MAEKTTIMEKQIKTIQIIHLALLAGIIAAYFFIGDMFNFSIPELEGENLYYIFIPAIAVLLSNFITGFKIKDTLTYVVSLSF